MIYMGVNYFSIEQMKELSENPYVLKVSEKAITYTEEFREQFYIMYADEMSPTNIMREMGFDVIALGERRIGNIVQRVKNMAEKGCFKDTRVDSSGRPRTKEMTPKEEIAYLRHKVEYQKQQIEALKKFRLWRRKRHGCSTRKIPNNSRYAI